MALRAVNLNKLMNRNQLTQLGRNKSTLWAAEDPKSKGFTWAGMKAKKEVLPLVFIMAFAGVGLCGYIVYASQTRENVVFVKKNKTISESMDLLNPRPLKIFTINEQYHPNAELAALYKDMEAAAAAQEQQ